MSHYTTVATVMRDESALLAALGALGYQPAQIEVHQEAQPLYGYQGDRRPERAHIIIRRQHIGRLANDVGFVRRDDGQYEAIISEYDQATTWPPARLQRLIQEYATAVAWRELTALGLSITRQEQPDGSVHLIATSPVR